MKRKLGEGVISIMLCTLSLINVYVNIDIFMATMRLLCMGKVPFTRLTNEILYFSLSFIKSFSVLSFQWWLFLDNVLHLMDDAQWSMNTRWKMALRNYSIKTSKVCHKVHKTLFILFGCCMKGSKLVHVAI